MSAPKFTGDGNTVLQQIQQECYAEMLVRLYTRARDRYLDACRLVGADTELAVRLREMSGFEHRTLQDIHDSLAAWFRFTQDDGGQMQLGEDAISYRSRLENQWRWWFDEEAGRLVADDEFTRAILKAAAHSGAEAGQAAESWLRQLLAERYATAG